MGRPNVSLEAIMRQNSCCDYVTLETNKHGCFKVTIEVKPWKLVALVQSINLCKIMLINMLNAFNTLFINVLIDVLCCPPTFLHRGAQTFSLELIG